MTATTKKITIILLVAVIVLLAFVLGITLGYENRTATAPIQVDLSTFWKTWQLIDEKFIDTNATTTATTTAANQTQERVWGAISGLVDSLGDPYTTFFPPLENKM